MKQVGSRKDHYRQITPSDLNDWWCNLFTADERKHIIAVFQPIGSTGDSLTENEMRLSEKGGVLSFLVCLTGWFDNPRDRQIAHKIIAKAEEYVSSEGDIISVHFFYPAKMRLFYKNRENPADLSIAIDACLKQIEISEKAAAAFLKEYAKYGNNQLPRHEGYDQLCVILEKQKKFDEAIKLAEQAKAQGWDGDWDKRIERCRMKSLKK